MSEVPETVDRPDWDDVERPSDEALLLAVEETEFKLQEEKSQLDLESAATCCLYVSNLSSHITEKEFTQHLIRILGSKDSILTVRLHTPDLPTAVDQAYCIVQFSSVFEAERARYQLYGAQIEGRSLLAFMLKDVPNPGLCEQFARLYVGNLDPMISEEELFSVFDHAPGGKHLLSVRIIRTQSRSNRTFGFLRYKSRPAAIEALFNLDGLVIGSSPVSVTLAKATYDSKGPSSVSSSAKESKSIRPNLRSIDGPPRRSGPLEPGDGRQFFPGHQNPNLSPGPSIQPSWNELTPSSRPSPYPSRNEDYRGGYRGRFSRGPRRQENPLPRPQDYPLPRPQDYPLPRPQDYPPPREQGRKVPFRRPASPLLGEAPPIWDRPLLDEGASRPSRPDMRWNRANNRPGVTDSQMTGQEPRRSVEQAFNRPPSIPGKGVPFQGISSLLRAVPRSSELTTVGPQPPGEVDRTRANANVEIQKGQIQNPSVSGYSSAPAVMAKPSSQSANQLSVYPHGYSSVSSAQIGSQASGLSQGYATYAASPATGHPPQQLQQQALFQLPPQPHPQPQSQPQQQQPAPQAPQALLLQQQQQLQQQQTQQQLIQQQQLYYLQLQQQQAQQQYYLQQTSQAGYQQGHKQEPQQHQSGIPASKASQQLSVIASAQNATQQQQYLQQVSQQQAYAYALQQGVQVPATGSGTTVYYVAPSAYQQTLHQQQVPVALQQPVVMGQNLTQPHQQTAPNYYQQQVSQASSTTPIPYSASNPKK